MSDQPNIKRIPGAAFKERIAEFVSDLPDRSERIVIKRYGLDGSKKMTLEAIGKEYDITRERVRQIESASLRDRKKSEKAFVLVPVEEFVESILKDHGGMMEHSHLVEKTREVVEDDVHPHHVEFVLHVSDKFNIQKEDDRFNKAWYLDEVDLNVPKKVVDSFVEILEEKNEPVIHNDLFEVMEAHDSTDDIMDHLADRQKTLSYLEIGKKIKRNPHDEWGLIHWSEINPRGVKDKAFIVLKKEGRPLHFTEITRRINEAGFSKKQAIPQTVHNELIKDERFVLVGRGIYALTSWGYKPGTVKDIVLEVLKSSEKPLTRDEIVAEVLKQRLVKKNTIVLALQNKDMICRDGECYIYREEA